MEDINGRTQSLPCAGLGHLLLDQPEGREYHALTGEGHMREEAVFDRVVLRAPWRIVGHANLDLESIRQSLQMVLEDVATRRVASASVTQH